MKNIFAVLVLFLVISVSSCAEYLSPGLEEVPAANANYGTPPVGYAAAIKNHFAKSTDGEAANLKVGTPHKAYTINTVNGKLKWLGYVVYAKYETKNWQGQYADSKETLVMFSNNKIIDIKLSDDHILHCDICFSKIPNTGRDRSFVPAPEASKDGAVYRRITPDAAWPSTR